MSMALIKSLPSVPYSSLSLFALFAHSQLLQTLSYLYLPSMHRELSLCFPVSGETGIVSHIRNHNFPLSV